MARKVRFFKNSQSAGKQKMVAARPRNDLIPKKKKPDIEKEDPADGPPSPDEGWEFPPDPS